MWSGSSLSLGKTNYFEEGQVIDFGLLKWPQLQLRTLIIETSEGKD